MQEIIKFIASGVMLAALGQPAVIELPALPTASVIAGEVTAADVTNTGKAEELFFGPEASAVATKAIIENKAEFVSTRKAYPASLAVIQKHEDTIREKARAKGVPEEVAIGVGLLENGGSETAKSPAGALGVYQLMPGTARSLGLKVSKNVDERRIPEKNIEAGMQYLKKNYERFGDWGLSTWAYHAGEGNVVKALQIYARSNHGIQLPGIKQVGVLRSYVESQGLTIHKLLSDPAVKNFTKKLNDDSQGYPYKVAATAKLFEEAGDRN